MKLALVPVIAAGLLAVAGTAVAQTDDAGAGGAQTLDSSVVSAMDARSDRSLSTSSGERSAASSVPATQVNVMREAGADGTEWAFGSSLIEAPKKRGYYPEGWLFVAKNDGGGWETELEGTPEFAAMTEQAPEGVVSDGEADTFSTQSAAVNSRSAASAGTRTGLMLPWKEGTKWYMTGGPHGWSSGYDRPYSALDFVGPNGGDQRVRSVAAGRAYKMCGSSNGGGWFRVYHPNGLSTDYYHLWEARNFADGKRIDRGVMLGLTGEDVCGGGAAYGRHVHFALLRGETHIAMNNRTLGGWTFKEGQAYGGSAERGGTVRKPTSFLRNTGPS